MKHLPLQLSNLKEKLEKIKIPSRAVFFILGIASTIWFLIRVIPKPSRATYPCVRAAAPFMSGFVIYLLTLGTAVFAFRKFRDKVIQHKYILSAIFLFVSVAASLIYFIHDANDSFASVTGPGPTDAANTPIGTATGIKPGRVIWAWNPDATNENCTDSGRKSGEIYDTALDDYYYNVRNNNQTVIDSMIARSLRVMTDKPTEEEAWSAVFNFFNNKKNGTPAGYGSGEKILIKVNAGAQWKNAFGAGKLDADLNRKMTEPDIVETTPFSVLAVLKSLINKGGVPQNMIYIGDPMKNIYQDVYEYWKAAFPNINILGNDLILTVNDVTTLGRVAVAAGTSKVIYSDAKQEDFLYDIFDQADYIINIAALKGHYCNGVTLCAKNHFGSHTRSSANHLHYALIAPNNNTNPPKTSNITNGGYNKYRVFVDLMGHPKLGGNTLLFIVDGLYSGQDGYFAPSMRWRMYPFNNDYPSSFFMSLDPVALESVCFDFLRTEYDGTGGTYDCPNYSGVDDYLHQAADKTKWPASFSYKPDGITEVGSLGAHEHWNNSTDKKYSRNIDPVNGKGIELVGIEKGQWALGLKEEKLAELKPSLNIFPNPAAENAVISFNLKTASQVMIEIYNSSGRKIATPVNQKYNAGAYQVAWNVSDLENGVYICRCTIKNETGCNGETVKIQVLK